MGYKGYINEFLDSYSKFKKTIKQINGKEDKKQQDFFEYVVDMAKTSVKFKLPDGASIFDFDKRSVSDVLSSYIGIDLHLPYPTICLEYVSDFLGIGQEMPVIVLAREHTDDIEIIMVTKKYEKDWGFMGNLTVRLNKSGYGAGVYYSDDMDDSQHEMMTEENKKAFIQGYGMQALKAVVQFLCALSCSNTVIVDDEFQPSAVKNKMRISKGKPPLANYKVLTIKVGDQVIVNATSKEHQNNKGTKRTHLRRGHIRQYQSGLKIWVNTCLVGTPTDRNMLEKSYRIK